MLCVRLHVSSWIRRRRRHYADGKSVKICTFHEIATLKLVKETYSELLNNFD